jgi:hypothetical protein
MTRAVDTHAVHILLCLYILEVSVSLVAIVAYRTPALDWALLSVKAAAALVAGGIGLIGSGWALARQMKASCPFRRRALALGLTTNLLSALIAFLLLETAVRVAARRTHEGTAVGAVTLRPTWPELTARSREVLAGSASWGTWDTSYFVYDRELGWTVGPNRRSPNGLYFSSVEGVRCAGPNLRLADQSPRFRVALIGDSHAFSFEVPFEESWGYHLQRFLGDDVQVLNFGVDGYGIDQMYLRYQRDVRPWKPQVLVIGFIGHDLLRTMAVYPIVTFGWPGYLVKPRFAIEHRELTLLNVPLPTPNEVLGASRIHELPFIEYDLGYRTADWDWRFEHGPLFLRFLTAAFPRRRIPDSRVSEEATETLNGDLLTLIIRSAEQAGSVPLTVLMSGGPDELARETLLQTRIPFLDVTDCLAEVPADRRRVESGYHYTGLANRAIARFTAPAIRLALGRVSAASGE